jgi:hypothetical protein
MDPHVEALEDEGENERGVKYTSACRPNRRSIPWLLSPVFDCVATPVAYFISLEVRILIGTL